MVKKSDQSGPKYFKPIICKKDFDLAMKDRKLTASARQSIKHHYFCGQHQFRGMKPKGRSPFQANESTLIFKRLTKKLKRFERDIKRHPRFLEKIKILAKAFPQLSIFLNKKCAAEDKWSRATYSPLSRPKKRALQLLLRLARKLKQCKQGIKKRTRLRKEMMKAWVKVYPQIYSFLYGNYVTDTTYPPRNRPVKRSSQQKLYDLCAEFGIAYFFKNRIMPVLPFSVTTYQDGSVLAMTFKRLSDFEIRCLVLRIRKLLPIGLRDNALKNDPVISFGFKPVIKEMEKWGFLHEEPKEGLCIRLSSWLTDQGARRLVSLIKKTQKKYFSDKAWKPLLSGKNLEVELEKYAEALKEKYSNDEEAGKPEKINRDLSKKFGVSIQIVKNRLSVPYL